MISVVCSSVNDHDGIGLFYHRPGGCVIFFAAERTLDLSIHP